MQITFSAAHCMEYIKKHCLFCNPDAPGYETDHALLYPQTFKEEDLNAEVFSARRVTEHFHYKIYKCKKTGLLFSGEILPDDVLLKLYADSRVTFNEYTHLIRKDYWSPLIPFADSFVRGSALEIGCSTGFFLEELLQQGYKNVSGCEPSEEAKALAAASIRENIFSGFFKSGIYEKESFDFVCSFQTLDHLSDPIEILRTCHEVLKRGGHGYFITHNTEALQAKIFGEKSPIIDVEHIYLFNKKTLAMTGEKAGFKTRAVFDIHNTYPLKYWMGHAPIPMKKLFMGAASFTGINKMQVKLKAGNIGVLFQKQ